ncbi:hypothetical protein [Burkholderia cepacia]|uniref:hypothetical protein n=1 Tax=Burkholderia cepacia TaxID=292 RepID=UPI0012D9848F|nr:hypothetical protein [Burkholderia cepacia]
MSFIVNVGAEGKNGERKRIRPTRASRGASTDEAFREEESARGISPSRPPADERPARVAAGRRNRHETSRDGLSRLVTERNIKRE